jgi:hypothetical protein
MKSQGRLCLVFQPVLVLVVIGVSFTPVLAQSVDPLVVLQQLGCKFDDTQENLRCPKSLKNENKILEAYFKKRGPERKETVHLTEPDPGTIEVQEEKPINVRNIFDSKVDVDAEQ